MVLLYQVGRHPGQGPDCGSNLAIMGEDFMKAAKVAAAAKAVDLIKSIHPDLKKLCHWSDQMRLGVGSGSTVAAFMPMLAEDSQTWFPNDIICTPTSLQAEELVAGSPRLKLNPQACDFDPEILVDGADEVYVDESSRKVFMIKGGGGAMVGEKIVAQASCIKIYMVDESKVSKNGLGEKQFPIPVEVIPRYRFLIKKMIQSCFPNSHCSIRAAPGGKAGPVITDNGNVILDLKPNGIFDPEYVDRVLDAIPGVVGHGIFCVRVDYLIIGHKDGSAEVLNIADFKSS